MSTFTEQVKYTANSWTNQDKITGTGIWSSNTYPWQELLPWQLLS